MVELNRIDGYAMSPHLIEVENVSKVFTGLKGHQVKAIDNVSMDVDEGELISIVGPSGCGKTTLLRIISGLMKPTEGTVTFDGVKVDGPIPDIGYVFQNANLFPWRTALGNISLPVEVRRLDKSRYIKKAEELVSLVGLAGFEDKYPFELSGGMQQRASLARAMVTDPRTLLMDEPFGALDALTREQMGLELLKVLDKRKTTVLFVTHDIAEAVFLADKVLAMSARPARIVKSLTIDIPRPRTLKVKAVPSFTTYCTDTREALGLI